MSTALMIFGALFLGRMLVWRLRARRYGMGGCGRGHFAMCGGGGFHGRGGPYVIGGPEDDEAPRGWGRRFGRWRGRAAGPFARGGASAAPAIDVKRTVGTLFDALELHERQRAEVSEALATIETRVGAPRYAQWTGLVAALVPVGEEPFDVNRVARLAGTADKEVLDALEHIHNVLTSEQHVALREAATRATQSV